MNMEISHPQQSLRLNYFFITVKNSVPFNFQERLKKIAEIKMKMVLFHSILKFCSLSYLFFYIGTSFCYFLQEQKTRNKKVMILSYC